MKLKKKNAGSLCLCERESYAGGGLCVYKVYIWRAGGRPRCAGLYVDICTSRHLLDAATWKAPKWRHTGKHATCGQYNLLLFCLMSHTPGYLIVTPAETYLGYGRGAAFGLQYLLRLLDMIRVHPPDKSYWKYTLCQRSMTSTVCNCSLEKKRAAVVLPFIEHISRINWPIDVCTRVANDSSQVFPQTEQTLVIDRLLSGDVWG